MTDYEQRVKVIETLGEIRAKYNLWNEKERHYYEALSEAIRVLNAENDNRHYAKIVRCKDCKHWNECGFGMHDDQCHCSRIDYWTNADFFCADGERKDDGQIQQSN